ncbi:xanthine dehydrogenase molybdopterin binding subunit [Phreatobacter stygius]|uniref:Xanthine dehydrogenase molybdopterin binding subunit n=1 Tax=Phreatobacter stygius TaxID=1940610 RepID=A0A4D7BKW3_9HYPH|nr:xanthine dehydrogenase molybdopterin binding subunit [Phreatobacter stygius]QCI68377.1 xanthine dehydrogenase molybdopterin binding subunit [Phreatobacter stygius]
MPPEPAPGNVEKRQTAERHVHQAVQHDAAERHVQGSAPYIDDVREPEGTLHVAPGGSPAACGRIRRLELADVATAPGVVAVLTARDIPNVNDVSPVAGDDPLFAVDRVEFQGQVIFAVVAETRDAARRAVARAIIEIDEEVSLVSVDDALAANADIMADYAFRRGDAEAVLAAAAQRIDGRLRIGGQEHFYLEGQAALAVPEEGGCYTVHSSTQHPSEVQHVVARVLGIADAAVAVEVRRMGGGFGGKESQASGWAAMAALAARLTGRPCKVRLDRDDDFIMTGKRHDFIAGYRCAHDLDGRVTAVAVDFASRCGYSHDLSSSINDRTMFHADNAYYYPDVAIHSRRMKTNTVSNTAFRGFGGPQGMLFAERLMDRIAWALDLDPLDVRYRNLYGTGDRNITPYGMTVEDNIAAEVMRELETTADYRARRAGIAAFNADNTVLKKGLALTPVKFGISFTTTFLNQAGALVHVYQDGSVHLNHGGTEMGQGLFIKVAQVVAEEFGIALDRVKITATHTGKVPNTSPTAASSGTDMNGMAAKNAAAEIKARLAEFIARDWQVPVSTILFGDDQVRSGDQVLSFGEVVKKAYLARTHLSAAGFYATPKITWDRPKATGRPFFYFAYGAACAEVTVDSWTGEFTLDRVDILHDVGKSLNPAIDIGQIEGGFVQGMGWLTMEELVYDAKGRLRTHAPSTYKIPTARDVPADFRVAFFDHANREATIYRSKAVGEPPLMLANAVFSAIGDAIHALNPAHAVDLDAPATPEAILFACEAQRAARGG